MGEVWSVDSLKERELMKNVREKVLIRACRGFIYLDCQDVSAALKQARRNYSSPAGGVESGRGRWVDSGLFWIYVKAGT